MDADETPSGSEQNSGSRSSENWSQRRAIFVAADKQASDVLDVFRSDIRFCANCFSKVRSVIPAEERVSDGDPANFITDKPVPDTGRSGGRDAKRVLAPADPVNGDWSYQPKGTITLRAPVSKNDGGEEDEDANDAQRGINIAITPGGGPETYWGIICTECGEHSHKVTRRPVPAHIGRSYMRNLSESMGILQSQYQATADAGNADDLTEAERKRIDRWNHVQRDLVDAYENVSRRNSAHDHDYDRTEFHRALRQYFAARILDDFKRE